MATNNKKTQIKAVKKKRKLASDKGFAYVNSSYNNTLISITDFEGNVISNSSPGVIGYTGSKKSTAYAATRAAEHGATLAVQQGLREVTVILKGLGVGRSAAVKGIRSGGMKITLLKDMTPIPHGGPSPRKAPRGS